jgi:hypothetical protein
MMLSISRLQSIDRIIYEYRAVDTLQTGRRNLSKRENPPQYHVVHHKSHVTWPWIKPGSQVLKATNVSAMARMSPWEVGSTSASQNIPHISWDQDFINAFIRTRLSSGLPALGFPIKILLTFLISFMCVTWLVQYSNWTKTDIMEIWQTSFLPQENKLG